LRWVEITKSQNVNREFYPSCFKKQYWNAVFSPLRSTFLPNVATP